MSVVIVGGNECMVRKYKELCAQFSCKVKIYPKMNPGMRNIGSPDLLVLFTSTISHKMVRSALSGVKGTDTTVARCHTSSMTALKGILEEHTA